jgi:putative transposase
VKPKSGVPLKNRTYVLAHHANDSKLDPIRDMLPVWKSCMAAIQYIQVQKIKSGEGINWLTAEDVKRFHLPLSARQIKSVTNQVNAALKAWRTKTKKLFRKELFALKKLSESERDRLHDLNNTGKWFTDPHAAHIMDTVLKTNPFPVFRNVRTMVLDDTVCQDEQSSTSFDRWLRVSTPTPRKVVYIPLSESDYFTSRDGEEASVTQVRINEDNSVRFSRVKQSPLAEKRAEGRVISLDWGLVSLFTTDDGRRLGVQSYERLKRLDAQLLALVKELQKNKIPFKKSKRYRNLNTRISESVANEVNRILNKLVEEDVAELVVESLDFRSGGLSRKLNRILSRAGRGAVRKKLSSLSEDTGVLITEVNPAYTSRECSGCGFASELNRRTQKKFRCVFCGKTCNADHNAAETIGRRRSVFDDGLLWRSKEAVLAAVDQRFRQRWGLEADSVRQRHQRGHSTATTDLL